VQTKNLVNRLVGKARMFFYSNYGLLAVAEITLPLYNRQVVTNLSGGDLLRKFMIVKISSRLLPDIHIVAR